MDIWKTTWRQVGLGGADGGSEVPSLGEQRERPVPEKGGPSLKNTGRRQVYSEWDLGNNRSVILFMICRWRREEAVRCAGLKFRREG